MDLRSLAQSILQTPAQVGKWGSEKFIYDPKEKVMFPQGLAGALQRADRAKTPEERRQLFDKATTMAVMGITSPAPAKSGLSSIHPDDMDVMEKVIDYARLKQPYNYKTEMMAGDILDKYPLKVRGNQPKNMNEVANVFDKALQKLINK